MKIIASIVFSLIVAIFAVKANKERFQEANNQILLDKVKEDARQSIRGEIAEIHVDRMKRRIDSEERLIRLATYPSDQALAIENLRESRAELRRYQSQLSR